MQFANSNATLDGKLAEHYFDFSFYYPESWILDKKSGVPGATNFVKVDRMLPPDFTQENFAVGWYTSSGTFVGDMPSYPQRVMEFSNSLAKIIPDYRKVSEGPTKVNSMDAYEFRWEGLSKGTERGDLNSARSIDIEFHRVLVHGSGNRLLIRSWEEIVAQIAALLYIRSESYPNYDEGKAMRDHEDIVLAYRARDLAAVKAANRRINEQAAQECLQSLQKERQFSDQPVSG